MSRGASISRLTCVFKTPPCRSKTTFCCREMAAVGMRSHTMSSSSCPISRSNFPPWSQNQPSRNVHTLCCRKHIFSAWRTDITHTYGSRTECDEKVCCLVHVVSLRLALPILMFQPPSLLFPDGHFSCSTSLPSFTRPKITWHAPSHTSGEEFVHIADSAHCTRNAKRSKPVFEEVILRHVCRLFVLQRVFPAPPGASCTVVLRKEIIHKSFFHVIDVLRIWFASHRKPATNLGELEIDDKITLIYTPNGHPVSEYW